ncbi:hypothetical protein J3Q64DRAFT_1115264 [Phycomyces blakesleeanus]|uniref:Uncharacterized protein n=2 Tax=Phycomyces blakesleeanus TaxID=4837 RepID=A0A167P1K8_PHYB8|nr:hypothetical protein PHYBLDRAFT_68118 [Phycomyces blakesleeanus NRRL 1555(-)]OAD77071.1 hypothetical protein PHYBLDRAFT_68118 [Phycomyces blakesleeanus NRRL 1555(-)]|eukprot:XP_018295111.1 hypothetical protein PHYBLDRAFT_68118 [Phycomyces blakesleeanus NRRL 1555(-)]
MVKFTLSFIIAALISVAVVQVRADSATDKALYDARLAEFKSAIDTLPTEIRDKFNAAIAKVDLSYSEAQAKQTEAARVANAANIDSVSTISSDASTSASVPATVLLATIVSALGLIALN